MFKAISRLVFAAVVASPFVVPQQVGRVTGTVTDTMRQSLPGVRITVTSGTLRRTVVTGPEGRYEVPDLAPGSYVITAELAGFETVVREPVTVTSGATTAVSFSLKSGCLDEVLYIDMGFKHALRETHTVVHLRITKSGEPAPCVASNLCVCIEHSAAVLRTLKPDGELVSDTIAFVQEGAGQLPGRKWPGRRPPYAPGQEFIAFLNFDFASKTFTRFNGPIYLFPVRNGRVEFRRTDAPGFSDGMSVDAFANALRWPADRKN